MKIELDKSIYEGSYLADKYSKYAKPNYCLDGVPNVNFPFVVSNLCDSHKYVSWIFIDHDSNPVVQFSWIHWLVANFEVKNNEAKVPEGLSGLEVNYVGGTNSYACPLAKITDPRIIYNYGGPTPPDCDHTYTLVVFSHSHKLNLTQGFYYNQLLTALEATDFKVKQAKIRARS